MLEKYEQGQILGADWEGHGSIGGSIRGQNTLWQTFVEVGDILHLNGGEYEITFVNNSGEIWVSPNPDLPLPPFGEDMILYDYWIDLTPSLLNKVKIEKRKEMLGFFSLEMEEHQGTVQTDVNTFYKRKLEVDEWYLDNNATTLIVDAIIAKTKQTKSSYMLSALTFSNGFDSKSGSSIGEKIIRLAQIDNAQSIEEVENVTWNGTNVTLFTPKSKLQITTYAPDITPKHVTIYTAKGNLEYRGKTPTVIKTVEVVVGVNSLLNIQGNKPTFTNNIRVKSNDILIIQHRPIPTNDYTAVTSIAHMTIIGSLPRLSISPTVVYTNIEVQVPQNRLFAIGYSPNVNL